MPNKTIKDDVVKWYSKKKYPCKRNKGEHEWGEPVITYKPSVRYVYKTQTGILDSHKLHPEYKLKRVEIIIGLETKCIHCGKKAICYMNDKII